MLQVDSLRIVFFLIGLDLGLIQFGHFSQRFFELTIFQLEHLEIFTLHVLLLLAGMIELLQLLTLLIVLHLFQQF